MSSEAQVADARLGVCDGLLVRIESRRGHIDVPARIKPIRDGTVFAPFHYGYRDVGEAAGPDGGDQAEPRAANELTMTVWDPVSKPVAVRYGESNVDEPERLHADALAETRSGPVGLLRDLQDLHLLATLAHSTWMVIIQAAQGARDHELLDIAQECDAETDRQLTWLTTRMKEAAPQALLVAG